MARITVEDCTSKIENRFELCLIASNIAKAIAKDNDSRVFSVADDIIRAKETGGEYSFRKLYDTENSEKSTVLALRQIASDEFNIEDSRKDLVQAVVESSNRKYHDDSGYDDVLLSDDLDSTVEDDLDDDIEEEIEEELDDDIDD